MVAQNLKARKIDVKDTIRIGHGGRRFSHMARFDYDQLTYPHLRLHHAKGKPGAWRGHWSSLSS